MKRRLPKLQFTAVLLLIMWWLSCQGVGGGGTGTSSDSELTGARSFRLGVADGAVGPVATTASLDSGESITVLSSNANRNDIQFVLYTTGDKVVRLTVDAVDRPTTAVTQEILCSYSNYSTNSVQVALTTTGTDGTPPRTVGVGTVPIADSSQVVRESAKESAATSATKSPTQSATMASGPQASAEATPTAALCGQDALDKRLMTLLQRAAVAVRLFGCIGTETLLDFDIPSSLWGELSLSACSSQLVQEILRRTRPSVSNNLTPADCDVPLASFGLLQSCDFSTANWSNDFRNSNDCALGIIRDDYFADFLSPRTNGGGSVLQPGGGQTGGITGGLTGGTVFPTAIPTTIPTTFPTTIPTTFPISIPTTGPGGIPTTTTTFIPTSFPTVLPTGMAPHTPTQFPGQSPTTNFSHPPTQTPSFPGSGGGSGPGPSPISSSTHGGGGGSGPGPSPTFPTGGGGSGPGPSPTFPGSGGGGPGPSPTFPGSGGGGPGPSPTFPGGGGGGPGPSPTFPGGGGAGDPLPGGG